MDVQRVYIPEIVGIRDQIDREAGGDCMVAWNMELLMPSTLLQKKLLTCDSQLLKYEWEVHRAQAAEALARVRRKIILETHMANHREAYGHGQRQGSKSHTLLADCRRDKAWLMATYNQAREALFCLAVPLDLLEGLLRLYPPLSQEDAVLIKQFQKQPWRETGNPNHRETSGETRRQLPWIWIQSDAMESMSMEGLQDGELLLFDCIICVTWLFGSSKDRMVSSLSMCSSLERGVLAASRGDEESHMIA